MKKTLFGFSAVALAAAAFVLPATGASVHDDPSPAPQAASKIDGNGGAAMPYGEDLALHFVMKYTKSSN